jgi:glucose-fructose oxidoreductase
MVERAGGRRRGSRRPVGYAVVGLGHIAQAAVLPAFAHAKNARLVALVSGDRQKLDELGERYGVKHRYGYDDYDACLANEEVDAVFIALPNDLHAEYTIRAARAGVHVLCEKPMAVTSAECEQMIRACEDAQVKLMIAYRLHFEPANLKAVELATGGQLGTLRYFDSTFSFQVSEGNIRVQRERGGGPVWDIGVYCINASRYLFRAEPLELFAFGTRPGDPRFDEVEETVGAVLRFPDERIASFVCSFGAASVSTYRLVGTEGDLVVEDAYSYAGPRRHVLTLGEQTRKKSFRKVDQFGPELVYFADCIRKDRRPEPSGQEGLLDVRIIEAIHESLRTKGPVTLPPQPAAVRRPQPEQELTRPALEEPELVGVEPPHP